MGTKYSTVSISNYNATPPADDGSQVASNKVQWATIKTKLTDPHNTAVAAINSSLVQMFNNGPTAKSSSYNTVAADYNTVLEVTGTTTIGLLSAATAGAGYFVTVKNAGSNTVTVTSADNIDGSASVSLAVSESATFVVSSGAGTYLKTATASAASGWQVIGAKQTASASNELDFTGLPTSGYAKHKFVISDLVPTTTSVALWARIYRGGVGPFTGTNYEHHSSIMTASSGSTYVGLQSGGTADSVFYLTGTDMDNVDGYGYTGELEVIAPHDQVYNATWRGTYFNDTYPTAGAATHVNGGGLLTANGAGAQDGIRFFMSTGTIASGTITAYGLL